MKTTRTISLTLDACVALGELASEASTSRSEVLEILIRNAQEKKLDLQKEKLLLLSS